MAANRKLTAAEEAAVETETPQAAEEAAEETAAPKPGSAEWYNERVTVKLFRDNERYKDDVFVGINGVGYRIQRGVEVQVPRFVAKVLEQSQQQDTATAQFIAAAVDKTE